MNLLLDTNALIELLSSSGEGFGPKAKQLLSDAENVYVSSISVVEIRIKAMLGKLEVPDNLLEVIEQANLKHKQFDLTEADAITMFPELSQHDPFDRMLLAQSQIANLRLLTSDKMLIGLQLSTVVSSRV